MRTKRVIDVVLGALLLLAALPIIAVSAIAIKLTSRGPIFYTQRRLGRNGMPFVIFKLRTMLHNCERHTGPQWSQGVDPRVTRVGRFLRRTHLDELPQLANVLFGHMSLVGPRPERPEIIAELERKIPRYHDRMLVRPGMTGLAQVQLPPDSDLDSVRRKLLYDLYYIDRLCLGLDLRLLVSTIFVVLNRPFRGPRKILGIPAACEIEGGYVEFPVSAGSALNAPLADI